MPSEFKAFIASICVLLLMMWLLSRGNNPWAIADSPISIVLLLVVFGLTYAWVKNEFFRDDD